jgi:hypothetical protein
LKHVPGDGADEGQHHEGQDDPGGEHANPHGRTLKQGEKPHVGAQEGLDVGAMKGANTKMPHMPKMMLGTAASSSIMVPTVRLTRGGANSTRKRAMARLRGTAMDMAMRVETRVPKMLLPAPNSWRTGFHSWEKKKPQPNCRAPARSKEEIQPDGQHHQGAPGRPRKRSASGRSGRLAEILTLAVTGRAQGLAGWIGSWHVFNVASFVLARLEHHGYLSTDKRGGSAPASLGVYGGAG